jgi:hypothetical protein
MTVLFAVLAMLVFAVDGISSELEEPIAVCVAGRPLDVEHSGHAAPCVADFDGDALNDLLVGEFYQGRLRVYRNVGTNAEPRFEDYFVFQDGVPEGRVPVG